MRAMVGAAALALLSPTVVWAERPDEDGALFAYDAADELRFMDSEDGRVRVHFSVDGPNQTLLADADVDGALDFPALVLSEGEAVLDAYAAMGFWAIPAEADLGLDPLGGSDALDIYLVDFGLSADGAFVLDGCLGLVCAGHVVMENDFLGYGYASLEEAVGVLVSHELFHGVQYAYTWDQPVWVSEGTAVWAEEALGRGHDDFLAFSSAYQEEAWRPLDRPPSGPVPAFAYGTALFWSFLSLSYGDDVIVALQAQLAAGLTPVAAVEASLGAVGATLEGAWLSFAEANLATGALAGAASFYPYADELLGVEVEAEGDRLDAELRLWGLGAQYLRIDHGGGELWLGLEGEGDGVVWSVFAEDPQLGVSGPIWSEASILGQSSLGVRPAGSYWLVATIPRQQSHSQTVRVCGGDEALAAQCLPESTPTPAPSPDEGATPTSPPDGDEPSGCACKANPSGGLASVWMLIPLLLRRRLRGACSSP